MKLQKRIQQLLGQEDLNFLLTNRLPRNTLTRFLGWFSKIEHPWVRDASIAIWKFFTDLDLSEAKKSQFTSMHDCFTRELKPGARKVNLATDLMCSPVDAIVGSHGQIAGTRVFQAKGFPYTLEDLIGPEENADDWRDGCYVTLRLTSSMYHRFHAPYDCHVDRVRYFSGDTWNVNPIALKRVAKLFCKNERAFIRTVLQGEGQCQGQRVALVPVAAILVASIRLHFLDVLFHLRYAGPPVIDCDHSFLKGQEMGWFQHGSTVIVLAPKGFTRADGIQNGTRIKVGQALMRWSG
ncbi:archaetidylserine decarboxylase [Rhodoferax sp.]|uniref:archaetidylserine decarboxylase n=1 Tax=Rhodoferax sp. TaxID=50421 RepID=UPI002850E1F0|nr:archaetidylserine decarboxylase [Rhodoferax sp.]MDR3369574.1 archaetidylserine decarboxylase [Rhodoferax sp.]